MKRLNLNRLQPKFAELIKRHLATTGKSQGELAKKVDMPRPHLNNLISDTPARKLTAYYLLKFISRGIIKVSEINDGNSKTKREDLFWKTASEAENIALLKKIAIAREKGIDIESLIDSVIGTPLE